MSITMILRRRPHLPNVDVKLSRTFCAYLFESISYDLVPAQGLHKHLKWLAPSTMDLQVDLVQSFSCTRLNHQQCPALFPAMMPLCFYFYLYLTHAFWNPSRYLTTLIVLKFVSSTTDFQAQLNTENEIMTGQGTFPILNDEGNRGPALLAVSAIATGIALVFTILRVFVRVRIVKYLGWDDMCIVVANVRAEHDPDSFPTLRK